MNKAWHITDWDQHYEVNYDGGRWKPGDKLRAGPAEYVRWYVLGPAGNNIAYLDMVDATAELVKAGAFAEFAESAEVSPNAIWMVSWGLFSKLLEVAGAQCAGFRGFLLGKGRSPSSARRLARISGCSEAIVNLALAVLSHPDIHLIEEREIPPNDDGSANSPNSTGASEKHKRKRKPKPNPKHKRKRNTNSNPNDDHVRRTSDEPAEANGEPQPASDSGSQRPASLDSDSDSAQQPPPPSAADILAVPVNPEAAAQSIKLALDYSAQGKTTKQFNADTTCFRRIGDIVASGVLGDPRTILNACKAKAREFAKLKGNPQARFMHWFKDQLAKVGRDWDKPP